MGRQFVLVHGGDDTDVPVGAHLNEVPLLWIPDEKEDNDDDDDDDDDDVHDHDNDRDDVDDDDVPPYAIDGVFRRRVPV